MGIAACGIAGNFVAPEQKTTANSFMHVGGDYDCVVGGNITSNENLEYTLRHGVKHLTAEVSKNPQGALEGLPGIGIIGKTCGQDFDGDGSIKARVTTAVHFSHSAGADGSEDFVRSELRASG